VQITELPTTHFVVLRVSEVYRLSTTLTVKIYSKKPGRQHSLLL